MGMLNWGAAFSKAGDAMASVGLEGVKATLEQDKIRLADELAEGRSVREGERGEARSVREGERGEKRTIAAEQRQPALRAGILNAETPILREREEASANLRVETDKRTRQGQLDVEYSADNIAKKVKALETVGAAEAKIKLNAEMESIVGRAKEPGYLDAVRAIARAQQVLTPGQLAEGELKQIEASRARTLEKMRGEYMDATKAGDTKTAGQVAQAIGAYTFDPARETQAVTAARAVVASMDATLEQKTQALNVLMGVAVKPQAGAAGAAAGAPPVGTVVGGKKFLGGNPNDNANWEKAAGPDTPARASTGRGPLNTTAPSTELSAGSETSRLPAETLSRIETQSRISRLEAAVKAPNLPEAERRRFEEELEGLRQRLTK